MIGVPRMAKANRSTPASFVPQLRISQCFRRPISGLLQYEQTVTVFCTNLSVFFCNDTTNKQIICNTFSDTYIMVFKVINTICFIDRPTIHLF